MKLLKNNILKNKKNFKILIISRLSSKRLKNKAKLKINNISIIEILVLRLLKYFEPNQIIICTSNRQNNGFYKKISKKLKISFFSGSELNIFKRILDCRTKFNFTDFVRVTGDNPLTDCPSMIKMLKIHFKNKNDYTFTDSLASGMRPEIISSKALKKASKLAADPFSSEYLSYFFLRKTFKIQKFKLKKYYRYENKLSITVDYKKDYLNLKKLIKNNIFMKRQDVIKKLKYQKKKVKNLKSIPVKTNFYDVSLKNGDQEILL